jgi:hypothetical protein
MYQKPIILLSLLSILFLNCKNEKTESGNEELEKSKVENARIEKPTLKIADENFEDFLKEFSRDSVFQITRVKFPLKVKGLDYDNMEEQEKMISKSDYRKLDFTYPKNALTRELDRYSQKNVLKNNIMVVEIRGTDNGIYSDFVFEKIAGKWFLKSWLDQST